MTARHAILFGTTMLAVPLLAAPPKAWAQPVDGFYVGAAGGGSITQSEKLRAVTPFPGTSFGRTKQKFDGGFVGLGSLGYGFGNGVRLEVEGDYRSESLKRRGTGLGTASLGGRETKYGGFGNALFDFDIGSPYIFPYVGVGAGYQEVKTRGGRTIPGLTEQFDHEKGSFAYQGIIGAAFPIPGVVGLSVTAEYRFVGLTAGRRIDAEITGGATPVSVRQKFGPEYNHNALIGVRYAFDVAPPASPAPPGEVPVVAGPARTYLVFFDWDRADLTAQARRIIADAATNAGKIQTTRIEVAGHADRSGTPAYNLALSRRRAAAVSGELVRQGVAQAEISVQAFGDTRPLVPTAAGVREPQNRRVEIVLK